MDQTTSSDPDSDPDSDTSSDPDSDSDSDTSSDPDSDSDSDTYSSQSSLGKPRPTRKDFIFVRQNLALFVTIRSSLLYCVK
jgi:hypothetical protein